MLKFNITITNHSIRRLKEYLHSPLNFERDEMEFFHGDLIIQVATDFFLFLFYIINCYQEEKLAKKSNQIHQALKSRTGILCYVITRLISIAFLIISDFYFQALQVCKAEYW